MDKKKNIGKHKAADLSELIYWKTFTTASPHLSIELNASIQKGHM